MNTDTIMTLQEVETQFDVLSDVTDRVALMNSVYESDLEGAFNEMEAFTEDARTWDVGAMEEAARKFYLSHMSFHREIVAEIIAEARQVLLEERRACVKRLVNYHRDFSRWLNGIEKKYAA
ncbi:MAG: PLU-1-like domain protein [Leptospirales bacterium]|jgi:hypothetical protein